MLTPLTALLVTTHGQDRAANVDKAEALVRTAHARGAHVVLLQELFETPYFPQEQDAKWQTLAHERAQHPTLKRMAQLARELRVVLPVSFFERCGQVTLIAHQRQQGRARGCGGCRLDHTTQTDLSSARADPYLTSANHHSAPNLS